MALDFRVAWAAPKADAWRAGPGGVLLAIQRAQAAPSPSWNGCAWPWRRQRQTGSSESAPLSDAASMGCN